MGTEWKTAEKGIRYREHPTRRYGNHADRYYTIFYKVKGKTYTEALGWESENRERGRSMLKRAQELLAQIRHNRRTGEAPVIKKDRIALQEAKLEEEQRKRQEEKNRNITLSAFYEKYYKPYAQRRLGEETFQHECSHYSTWLKNTVGDVPIQLLKLVNWEPLLVKLFDSKLKIRSKIYICGTLCRLAGH